MLASWGRFVGKVNMHKTWLAQTKTKQICEKSDDRLRNFWAFSFSVFSTVVQTTGYVRVTCCNLPLYVNNNFSITILLLLFLHRQIVFKGRWCGKPWVLTIVRCAFLCVMMGSFGKRVQIKTWQNMSQAFLKMLNAKCKANANNDRTSVNISVFISFRNNFWVKIKN